MAVDFGVGFVRVLPDLVQFSPALTAGVVEAGEAVEAQVSAQYQRVGAAAVAASEQAATAASGAASDAAESWDAAAVGVNEYARNLVTSVIGASEQAVTQSEVAARGTITAWEAAAKELSAVYEGTAAVIRSAADSMVASISEASREAASVSAESAGQVSAAWQEAGAGAGSALEESVTTGAEGAAAAGTAAAAEVGGAFAGVRASITGLFTGAIALGGLDIATRGAVEYAHGIQQISDAMNVGSQSAARLKAQAGLIGVDVNVVIPVISRLTKATQDAGSSASQALDRWGISAEKFRNSGVTEQLELLSQGYQKAGDRGKQFIADVIGGRGTRITPLIAQYRELEDITNKVKYPIPSHDQILAMSQFQLTLSNLVRRVEITVIPVMIRFQGLLIGGLGIFAIVKIVKIAGEAFSGFRNILVATSERIAAVWIKATETTTASAEAIAGAQADAAVAADGLADAEIRVAGASEDAAVAEDAAAVSAKGLAASEDAAATSAVALGASIRSIALTAAGIGAALYVGINTAIHVFESSKDKVHQSGVNLGVALTDGLASQLERVGENQSFWHKFTSNIHDLFFKGAFNVTTTAEASTQFAGTVKTIIDAGLTKATAGTFAKQALHYAIVRNLGLDDPQVKHWIANAIKLRQASDYARYGAARRAEVIAQAHDEANALSDANNVLAQFNQTMGQSIDLSGKASDVVANAQQAYKDWADQLSQSLNFVTSDLEFLSSKNNVTAEGIQRHLDLQLREMDTFNSNLNTIAESGTKAAKETAKQLASMGTAGYQMAYDIAHATPQVRKHIEDDILTASKVANTESQSLEKSLVGGFTRIAAAILLAMGQVHSWSDAMREASNLTAPKNAGDGFRQTGKDAIAGAEGLREYESSIRSLRNIKIPILGNLFPGAATSPDRFVFGNNYRPHRAMGGEIEPNRAYTVGERGPETFVSGVRGEILPAGQGLGGGGRAELVITNWESGKGYIRWLARDEAAQAQTYDQQRRRMGGR